MPIFPRVEDAESKSLLRTPAYLTPITPIAGGDKDGVSEPTPNPPRRRNGKRKTPPGEDNVIDRQPKAGRKGAKKANNEYAEEYIKNRSVESEPHVRQPRPKRRKPAEQAEEKERLRQEESRKFISMPGYVSLRYCKYPV